ncbi:MAG: tyrosine--tRNA ligase, partial [Chloroflexi bacterium]|nr:tyrosine--tRNA ligase [Chloroflexota bacterium]
GQTSQQAIFVPLLVGTDGAQKMSKSLGNYIGVAELPNDMYGKVMSIPDTLIIPYFELLTDVDDEELEEFRRKLAGRAVNPMDLKQRLAREIVAEFHGPQAADAAQSLFRRVFLERAMPHEVSTFPISFEGPPGEMTVDVTELLPRTGSVASRSEARRLVRQGAVEIDGRKIDNIIATVRDGSVVKVGKSRFVKLVNADREA